MNCIQPTRAGRADRQVAAVVGLDAVDRGEDLPAHAVLDAGGLVERKQEGRDLEAVEQDVRDRARRRRRARVRAAVSSTAGALTPPVSCACCRASSLCGALASAWRWSARRRRLRRLLNLRFETRRFRRPPRSPAARRSRCRAPRSCGSVGLGVWLAGAAGAVACSRRRGVGGRLRRGSGRAARGLRLAAAGSPAGQASGSPAGVPGARRAPCRRPRCTAAARSPPRGPVAGSSAPAAATPANSAAMQRGWR